jgi:glycerol uptake facilitator-like aquaporin
MQRRVKARKPLKMNNVLQIIIALITGGIIGGTITYLLLKKYMIQASDVKALIDALNTAITAETSDAATLATAKATITQLQTQVADLNDPALAASVTTALANASAANPPPAPAPAPVNTPPASS